MIKKYLLLLIIPIIMSGCSIINKTSNPNEIELSFSSWGTQTEINIIKNIIREYENENPNIKINLIHIPENYYKKLHLLIASHNAPDIVLINNQNIEKYGDYLLPINKSDYEKKYFKNAISVLSKNNELKAVPRDISMLVIYINKTMLKRYGIQMPKDSWSIDDLKEISKKLKYNNKYSILLENDIYYLYPFILSIDGENIPSDINELKDTQGWELYTDFQTKYHYSPEAYEIGKSTGAEFFINEKIAFYLSGKWMEPKIKELAKFEWDIQNFPHGENGSKVPIDATGWGISNTSKHPQEALNFIKYLSNNKNIKKLSKCGLIIPANKEIANEILLSPNDKNTKLYYKLSEEGITIKYPSNYNQIRDIINKELSNKNY